MKSNRLYYIFSVLLLGALALFFYNKYNVAPKIDLEKLQLLDENEQSFEIKSLKGKRVIISFYASWCPNCIDELVLLNKMKDVQLKDIEIVCITDESIDKMISFKERKGYHFSFFKLKTSFSQIGINSIPTVYLLNANNQVVYDKVGYVDWEDHSTITYLKELLNQNSN